MQQNFPSQIFQKLKKVFLYALCWKHTALLPVQNRNDCLSTHAQKTIFIMYSYYLCGGFYLMLLDKINFVLFV